MKILLIQGANMEFLGRREPDIYGTTTAAELNDMLDRAAPQHGLALDTRYTNHEGEAIDWIYDAVRAEFDGLIMNPAGFLHSGHALCDCLRGVVPSAPLPYVEVHMSNIDARGRHSATAPAATAMISGMGTDCYLLALDAMARILARRT